MASSSRSLVPPSSSRSKLGSGDSGPAPALPSLPSKMPPPPFATTGEVECAESAAAAAPRSLRQGVVAVSAAERSSACCSTIAATACSSTAGRGQGWADWRCKRSPNCWWGAVSSAIGQRERTPSRLATIRLCISVPGAAERLGLLVQRGDVHDREWRGAAGQQRWPCRSAPGDGRRAVPYLPRGATRAWRVRLPRRGAASQAAPSPESGRGAAGGAARGLRWTRCGRQANEAGPPAGHPHDEAVAQLPFGRTCASTPLLVEVGRRAGSGAIHLENLELMLASLGMACGCGHYSSRQFAIPKQSGEQRHDSRSEGLGSQYCQWMCWT